MKSVMSRPLSPSFIPSLARRRAHSAHTAARREREAHRATAALSAARLLSSPPPLACAAPREESERAAPRQRPGGKVEQQQPQQQSETRTRASFPLATMSVARGSKLLNYINYRELAEGEGCGRRGRFVFFGRVAGGRSTRKKKKAAARSLARAPPYPPPRPSLSLITGMRITMNDGRQIVGR